MSLIENFQDIFQFQLYWVLKNILILSWKEVIFVIPLILMVLCTFFLKETPDTVLLLSFVKYNEDFVFFTWLFNTL